MGGGAPVLPCPPADGELPHAIVKIPVRRIPMSDLVIKIVEKLWTQERPAEVLD
jgi:hypothetical protein